jgi:FAD/FMN-containing dehydrogenase
MYTPLHPFPSLALKLAFSPLGTGEHGIGIGKKEFLVEELGEGTVGLMKMIKRAIDPLGIMNPGKVGTPFVTVLGLSVKLVA